MELFFWNFYKEFNKILLTTHTYTLTTNAILFTLNVTIVQIINWLTLKHDLKMEVHSQPYKNIQPTFLCYDKTNQSHKMISNFTN